MFAKLIGLFSGFPSHHFTEEIAAVLHENLTQRRLLVLISAWPDAYEQNDDDSDGMHMMFTERGMGFDAHLVIDRRTDPADAVNAVRKADCIFLMGGDSTLQITLIHELGLDHELQKSHAVILGVSAGSMNLGRYVADVWETKAWYDGLGLTDFSIKAHYAADEWFIPILEALSAVHPIIAMEDESAIFINSQCIWKLGKMYRIAQAVTAPLTDEMLLREHRGL